ncbi:MAG: hypothetical protein HOV87_06125 [Catenulispora sp.]|nr:hypothetical protein [Catenulispora sp.]
MTTVVYGVQAKSPAPLFRVVGGAAVASYRPVAGLLGQECARFSGLSGSEFLTRYVGGVRLAEHVLAESAQGHKQAQDGKQAPAQQTGRREVLLARVGGFNGTNGTNGIFSENGSTDGGNGSQPMSPWGYRTSSPPG